MRAARAVRQARRGERFAISVKRSRRTLGRWRQYSAFSCAVQCVALDLSVAGGFRAKEKRDRGSSLLSQAFSRLGSSAIEMSDRVDDYYAALDAGDRERLRALTAPNAVFHVPGNIPLSGDHRGHDQIAGLGRRVFSETNGTFKLELLESLSNGAYSAVKHRWTATRRDVSIDSRSRTPTVARPSRGWNEQRCERRLAQASRSLSRRSTGRDTGDMSREKVELAKQVLDAVTHRDLSRLIAFTDPEVEWHSFFAELGEEGVYRGHDGMRQYVRDLNDAWEILRPDVDDGLEVDDVALLVGRLHYRGTTSGVETEAPAGWMFEFRDGKVIRFRAFREPGQALGTLGRRG